jgi:hypothetical protein
VGVAVAGQLVAGGHVAADHRGIALGDPAEREERGVRAALREAREQALHVVLDAALDRVPRAARDVGRHRRDLEVVLDVHGQRVDDRARRGAR